jgi:hypothetical protein
MDFISRPAATQITLAAIMKAHLERLRDQAAECAMLSAEAETREKRELFARLYAHLTEAADHLESVINGATLPDARVRTGGT